MSTSRNSFKIGPKAEFLVVNTQFPSLDRTVRRISAFPDVIGQWTPGSRLSPIWPVEGTAKIANDDFAGTHQMMFLGPIDPYLILTETTAVSMGQKVELWVTAGCFNVIARCLDEPKETPIDILEEWARDRSIPFERWRTHDGKIEPSSSKVHDTAAAGPVLEKLSELSKYQCEPALYPAFSEFIVVAASAASRASAMSPPILEDLTKVIASLEKLVEQHKNKRLSALAFSGRLTHLNAALSRFSSQAFSGVPPILGTECHFWTHSLLGTGTANLALINLAGWIQTILGEALLPQRLEALRNRTASVPNLNSLLKEKHFSEDVVYSVNLAEGTGGPLVPLITYFSGRDGFSSHYQTLSVPVTTLVESNSYRSNLLTSTHEISHIFIDGVLGKVFPTTTEGLEAARMMISPAFVPGNWFEAAQQLLMEGMISLEQADKDIELLQDEISAKLPLILQLWRSEAREILVHAFDFLYFYAGEIEYYVQSIWNSWSAIPGVDDRIGGYVLRTLTAVSALDGLRTSETMRLKQAIQATKTALVGIKDSNGQQSEYVARALAILEDAENNPERMKELDQDYTARMYLVRFVRTFLYSEQLASRLWRDVFAVRDGRRRRKALVYDEAPIGNPLAFLKGNLEIDPSEAHSLWVLHCLAFRTMEVTDASA